MQKRNKLTHQRTISAKKFKNIGKNPEARLGHFNGASFRPLCSKAISSLHKTANAFYLDGFVYYKEASVLSTEESTYYRVRVKPSTDFVIDFGYTNSRYARLNRSHNMFMLFRKKACDLILRSL